jgi:hypothetical protein
MAMVIGVPMDGVVTVAEKLSTPMLPVRRSA